MKRPRHILSGPLCPAITEYYPRTRHIHRWAPFNLNGVILGWCSCGKVNKGDER